MRVARHGEAGADHAETLYRVVDTAGQNIAWLEAEPVYRPHSPIAHPSRPYRPSDHRRPEIFQYRPNWELPGGIQKRLHLHARHIDMPHPDGGRLKVTAPLPPHMVQTFNLLGLDGATAEAA